MRDIKRMSGGAAIIQLVKSLTATPNTAELTDIVDDIKDDIKDINTITTKIDAKIQDLEAVSGKAATQIKTELVKLKKEEKKETAEGKMNLEDLKKKIKEFSVASNKKGKAVKARIDAIIPSLKKSSPAELRNVCDTLVNEVIAANNEKLAQMENIEKILEPVRDNVEIGAVKMLANIAKMREDDKKNIAKILALQKEMKPDMKGGYNVYGVGVNTRAISETLVSEENMLIRLINLVKTVVGLGIAYLVTLVGFNTMGLIFAAIGPSIISGFNHIIAMATRKDNHGVSEGIFNLLRYHPYYTEITFVLVGITYLWATSKSKDD